MAANFADSIRAIAPAWLKGPIADALLTGPGTVMNALATWAVAGVRARYPSTAPPDALGYIGNDRNLERGPAQTDDGYRVQLRRAFDTWRVAGNASTVLRQLAAYFTGVASPPMRTVTDAAVWHEYSYITEQVTKTIDGTNWTWDGFTGTRWWRGWVILDSTAAPWTIDVWNNDALWGDGGTWGTSASYDEVISVLRIVAKWKPAHVHNVYVIVTFDPSLLERTDASPPNPSGTSDTPGWRSPLAAAFWPGLTD